MTLYMLTTRDKYELPLCVADSPDELARMRNLKRSTVVPMFSKIRHGKIKKSSYKIVEVEDD